LPENGYLHVAGGIPILQMNEGHITKIIAEEEAYYAAAWISDIWKHSFEQVGNLTLSEEVQVILYHTHNAETYLPDDGVSKVSGQNGGVVDAAKVFRDELKKKYGIRTAHSTTIHDYPDWSRSYQNSLNTAKQLLKAYPEAQAVFDIHRDAGFTSKKTTTATVHGKKAAKIMMVIGCTTTTGKKIWHLQDCWRQNAMNCIRGFCATRFESKRPGGIISSWTGMQYFWRLALI
ncbi:MAG: stage II sporulation protein P, partial [Peptococcaceae bacterium]|nr:stage II sporulation protein P [Peptococcaceae bacterium]